MPFQDFIPAGGKKSGGETNAGFSDFVPARKPGKRDLAKKPVEKPAEKQPEKKPEEKPKKDK